MTSPVAPQYYLQGEFWTARGYPSIPVDPPSGFATYVRAAGISAQAPAWSNAARVQVAGLAATAPPVVVVPPDPGTGDGPALTAGSAAPGATTYGIPATGQVLYVDPVAGSDTAAGTAGAPYRTLAKAVSVVAAGGTVILRGGNYHEGGNLGSNGVSITTNNVTVQSYPGEAVWFDGSSVLTGFTTDTTSVPGRTVYKAPYTWVSDRSPTFDRGTDDSTVASWQFVNPSFPCAPFPDQIFIDGVRQTQVNTLAQVNTGTFWVQGTLNGVAGTNKYRFTPTQIFLGTNPAGHEVRYSDLSTSILITSGTGVTLRGFGIRRYGTAVPDLGCMKAWATGATLENVWFEEIATIGMSASLRAGIVLRNVTTNWCGLMGVHSNHADGLMVDGLRSQFNNHQNFNFSPATGGIKVTRMLGCTIKNSVVSDNFCQGIWHDESVYDWHVLTCDVQNNAGHGIIAEISDKGVVADCVVINNGKVGAFIRGSDKARVWNNTMSVAGEGVLDFTQDARRPGTDAGRDERQPYPASLSYMTWVIASGESCNNVLRENVASGVNFRVRSQESPAKAYSTFGLTVNGNFYNRPNVSNPTSAWALAQTNNTAVGYSTFAAYRTGSANTYDAQSRSLDGTDGLNGTYPYLLNAAGTTAAASVTPLPLPADIATMIGRPAGSVKLGAWR